jgi:putative Mn2+ efflux pump MntP
MIARAVELALVAVVAAVIIGVIAAPVIREPSTRIFGTPLVGTHHDPFTMMQVWASPVTIRASFQPLTDVPGHWLAASVGPVAAFNWLVLATFPLAAVAAFALARHLALPRGGAMLAALAFAFSPVHLAHAAYHPHIAQVQWIPLFVLALWHALARGSLGALVWLGAATMCVTLSNFYGGLIVGVLTPVLVVVGWAMSRAAHPRPMHRLLRVSAMLGVIACGGVAYVAVMAPEMLTHRNTAAVSTDDVSAYSARAVAYVVPPAAHPWLGAAVVRMWRDAGVGAGLLEQQVSLGWGVLALGAIAVGTWLRRARVPEIAPLMRAVPALLAVGVAGVVLSASPRLVIGSGLHEWLPMFRAYARFGVMVQLMAVLLAGIGLAILRQRATAGSRWLGAALVVLIACEYVVSPLAASREIFQTTADRWVHDHASEVRVLDCTPFSPAAVSSAWLAKGRIQLLGGPFEDCSEPHLAPKLAALGFSHLLIRAGTDAAQAFSRNDALEGLDLVHRDSDASLWVVTESIPAIYVVTMSGLSPRETDGERSWRWMGDRGEWSLVNPGATTGIATLHVELSAFHHRRAIIVAFDGGGQQHVTVLPDRRGYVLGPWRVTPGSHVVTFQAPDPPTIPADVGPGDDRRPLTIAFGGWRWEIE